MPQARIKDHPGNLLVFTLAVFLLHVGNDELLSNQFRLGRCFGRRRGSNEQRQDQETCRHVSILADASQLLAILGKS
jgi:hypothetical protein